MGTGRGAEAQAELGSRGVRRHAAGVCQGGAAAPGGGAGLARCKAQAYEQELVHRVRFSSRVDLTRSGLIHSALIGCSFRRKTTETTQHTGADHMASR